MKEKMGILSVESLRGVKASSWPWIEYGRWVWVAQCGCGLINQ
jgi:hypothetical protein